MKKHPKPLRKGKALTLGHPDPLWRGPGLDGDGITNSLLCKFLQCRERFRLQVVEGLKEDEGFNAAIEYGSMWHEMEEATAKRKDPIRAAGSYRDKLREQYPGAEGSINKWFKLAKRVYPVYRKHWAKHPDTKKRKTVAAEVSFRVPYQLPSGRSVLLRGKWDWVFKQGSGIWLMEHKTKGRIDEAGLQATVHENLQTMLYLIALKTEQERLKNGKGKKPPVHSCLDRKQQTELALLPIKGIVYNVAKRPLSDQHAQKQRKGREVWNKTKTRKIRKGAETEDQFLDRVAADIAKDPKPNFMRWKATIGKTDVVKFKRECFDPILEDLCEWWESLEENPFDPWTLNACPYCKGKHPCEHCNGEDRLPNPFHYRFPWGVYHNLASGFRGDFFEYLTTGRKDKLIRVDTLFPELKE